MFSLQSKIRQSDRDQQKWSSEGNTKVKQVGSKTSVSGGPKLKETQTYPTEFCSNIASYHKTWCIDTQLNP